MLSTRLLSLEEIRVLERRTYCQHPRRYEYQLTETGSQLRPTVLALKE